MSDKQHCEMCNREDDAGCPGIEADALIAGAYLAVDALISKGWHSDQCASLRNQWHIDDPEACDCWNGLLRASVRELPPDAARLALEEREKAIRALLLEGFNIVSSAYAHVSHGGPTREEALAWIKKVEKQMEGQL